MRRRLSSASLLANSFEHGNKSTLTSDELDEDEECKSVVVDAAEIGADSNGIWESFLAFAILKPKNK